MFEIVRTAQDTAAPRLLAPQGLAQTDFADIARAARVDICRARKIGFVAAREVHVAETLVTVWNEKETQADAQQGDYIATNLTADRDVIRDNSGRPNQYVISGERFPMLYTPTTDETEFGRVFRPLSEVDAIYLAGGFDILAPWGERQLASQGYLLNNGSDIYGNHKDTFEATYEVLR